MLIAGIFFGLSTALMVHLASTNDRGLVINGIIHLDRDDAAIFWWGMAAASAVMAAIGLMKTLFGLLSNQSLSISDTELSAPKSLLSPANTVIPLSSIVRLELKSVRNFHFLKVHHRDGKLTIQSANLPDAEAFEIVCMRLAAYHRDRMQGRA
jgi:hypothetical protein